MATVPKKVNLKGTSAGVLNAVRSGASEAYKQGVPLAEDTAASLAMVGEAINGYQARRNEFVDAIINRIGMVVATSRMFSNPWKFFKKGVLEYGESIEEIFVDIARIFNFDPAKAETDVFKRVKPNIKSAFHSLNYKKFYKVTVSREELRAAFLSADGVVNLVERIIQSMYSAAEYDEFLLMKYLFAKLAVDGKMHVENIPAVTAYNAKDIVTTMKEMSNDWTFPSRSYNMAGVLTSTPKERQYLIKSTRFDALVDVEVLAQSFNMERATFAGRQVLIDKWSKFDYERLKEIFTDDDTETEMSYVEFTDKEKALLETIQVILVDEDFMLFYDNLIENDEIHNPQGLYWNYFNHQWKLISASPFAQNTIFTTATGNVTAVTVTPNPASIMPGFSMALTGNVTGTGFYSKYVTWAITGNASEETYIDPETGLLVVASDETASTLTVTATSVGGKDISGTGTINIVTA